MRLTPKLVGQGFGGTDFLQQKLGAHGAAGNHAKAAGIGNGRYQSAFGQPCHGTTHDGAFHPQKGISPRHQCVQALGSALGLGHCDIRFLRRHHCVFHAALP
nr:hypothetical protein [Iodidimonas gelatinilytica]